MIDFQQNALSADHPDLAGQFEREIAEAAGGALQGVCRIEAEGSDPTAPDRARVVLVDREKVFEWTIALPVAPGDVARAARRALGGGTRDGERRRPERGGLDRRRP